MAEYLQVTVPVFEQRLVAGYLFSVLMRPQERYL
jgi:hypothetical protein